MFDVEFCYGMDFFQRQQTRAQLFPMWFYDAVRSNRIQVPPRMYALASFPTVEAKTYRGYFANGFRFKTLQQGRPLTTNCGVCVLGDNEADADPSNYYGILRDVLVLNYSGSSVVMFKCEWFDNTPNLGVWTKPEAGLVEVNQEKRLRVQEPFILASQATQVYYALTPANSKRTIRARRGWLSVFTGRARHVIVGLKGNANQQPPQHPTPDEVYQDDTSPIIANVNRSVVDEIPPVLSTGVLERVEEGNYEGPAEVPTNEQIFLTDDVTEFYSSEEDPDINA